MLSKKQLKAASNLANILVEKGWCSHNTENSVLSKNRCFLFLDEPEMPGEKFQYENNSMSDEVTTDTIMISSVGSIPKASWHAEYEGVVISYGKIPSSLSKTCTECTATEKKQINAFAEELDELATNAENLALMSPSKFTATTVNVYRPSYTEISSLEEGSDLTLLYFDKMKTYISLKEKDGVYMAIPVKLEEKNEVYRWVVKPEFVQQGKSPSMFTAEEIYELIRTEDAKLLNVSQKCEKNIEYKWSQGTSLNSPKGKVKDLLDIEVDDVQLHYLDMAYDNKLNIAALVKNNYDSITLKWLLKFMLKDYEILGISTSLKEESLSLLYDIASSGFFINKYTSPDLSVEMIKNKHNQFLSGFAQREDMLLEQGYKRESIDVILKVASRGDGFSHVMYKEPPLKLYLRDYAFRNGCHILADYMLKEGIVEGTLLTAFYDGMPQHIKLEVQNYIDCLGDTLIDGVPWREYCGYDKIKKLIFREDMKLMVVTEKGYIRREQDYVLLKSDIINVKACITCINNKIIVEA